MEQRARTTSEQALRQLGIKDTPEKDRPLSEEFRIVGREWVDAENAASLMEELKTTTLEQKKADLIATRGDMADNKAERIVKSSPEWEEYITTMCRLRGKATKLKIQMEWIRMKQSEAIMADANARAERRF